MPPQTLVRGMKKWRCHQLRGPLSPFKTITDINYYIFLDSQRLDLCMLTIKINIFKKIKKYDFLKFQDPPNPPWT